MAVCTQQHETIRSQILAARTKLLVGSDNIHCWRDRIWNAVLTGMRIIVSPRAVLLDALGHGYVRMSRLALLVLDGSDYNPWMTIILDGPWHELPRE